MSINFSISDSVMPLPSNNLKLGSISFLYTSIESSKFVFISSMDRLRYAENTLPLTNLPGSSLAKYATLNPCLMYSATKYVQKVVFPVSGLANIIPKFPLPAPLILSAKDCNSNLNSNP